MSRNLLQKIDACVKASGKSEFSLLRDAGLSRDLIRDIRRKQGSPTLDTIAKIAAALEVSPSWLAFDHGDPAAQWAASAMVPILGPVAAGSWLEVDDHVDETRSNREIVADPRFPLSAQYGLTSNGESMNRLFRDQDDLLCLDYRKLRGGPRPESEDVVIVEQLRDGGRLREISAKRLRFTKEGPKLYAESDHPKWRDTVLTPTADNDNEIQVTIQAIVLRSERQWWRG
jgi:transcriptional regulator with XRE-family HTH domain